MATRLLHCFYSFSGFYILLHHSSISTLGLQMAPVAVTIDVDSSSETRGLCYKTSAYVCSAVFSDRN